MIYFIHLHFDEQKFEVTRAYPLQLSHILAHYIFMLIILKRKALFLSLSLTAHTQHQEIRPSKGKIIAQD